MDRSRYPAGGRLPASRPTCFADRVSVRQRAKILRLLVVIGCLSGFGCGGLVSSDAAGQDDEDDSPADSVGFDTGECPPSQWDCSGVPLSCDYIEDETGEPRPTISLEGACRCDLTRPAEPADCGAGELFVCGSLSYDASAERELAFDPVSCRCAVNSGYYCNHCALTGLYAAAADAAGCGLAVVEDADSTAVYCGCGP